ncbi:MAG: hypothetical protein QXT77_07620 [Candidatus Methanomethylicaceae archaeon]
MDPIIGGSLIAAGGSIAGSLMGASSQRKANKRNILAQREFAQKGIRWRVADAKAAGVHPLFALGAQTSSFTPSIQPTTDGSGVANASAHIGDAVARKGMQKIEQQAAAVAAAEAASRINANNAQADFYRAQAESSRHMRGQQSALVTQDAAAKAESQVAPPAPAQSVDVAGNRVLPRPGWSNAEDFEARYGEIGGLAAGIVNTVVDTAHNLGYDQSVTKSVIDYLSGMPERLRKSLDSRQIVDMLNEFGRFRMDRYYHRQYLEK